MLRLISNDLVSLQWLVSDIKRVEPVCAESKVQKTLDTRYMEMCSLSNVFVYFIKK